MRKLELSHAQVQFLSQQSYAILPREACALLFGLPTIDGIVVKDIVFVRNRSRSATSFRMCVGDIEQEKKKRILDLVGIYHSHVNQPAPSKRDCVSMIGTSLIWVIGNISVHHRKVIGFNIYIYDPQQGEQL